MAQGQWRRYLHFWKRTVAADIDEELRFHADQRIDQYMATGMSRADATAAAATQFGDVHGVRAGLIEIDRRIERRARIALWLDALVDDVRWSVRSIRRQPGFAFAAIVALGLGVGANAAMFAVLDRVFFQSPPGVNNPSEVWRIYARQRGWSGNGQEYVQQSFSVPDLDDARIAAGGAVAVAGYSDMQRTFSDQATPLTIGLVTDGFFDVLGVRPARGRFFSADETRYGDPRALVILSHSLWRREFGGDPQILGRAIKLDAATYTVIGVAPSGFDGLDLDAMDAWVPLASLPGGAEGSRWRRGVSVVRLIARVNGDINLPLLDKRLTTGYRAGNRDERWFDRGATMLTAPLLVARGPADLGDLTTRNLAVAVRLGGVALIVLVIATSNVASLLLMRAFRRRREIAVRVALGISRRRLIAQLLAESLMLGLLSAAVAVVVAQWAGAALRSMLLGQTHWSATVVDQRVVALSVVMGIVASLAAGLAPASLATRPDILSSLKSSTPEGGTARSSLRIALLVGQAALCMVLICGAGVFLQSLRRAMNVDMGFDTDPLITVSTSGYGGRLHPEDFEAAVARLRALPSIEVVGAAVGDLRGGNIHTQLRIADGDTIQASAAAYSLVDGDFARAAGLRVVRGRVLSAIDGPGAQPSTMINESMAKAFWRSGNALGSCLRFAFDGICRTIVGIVADVRWNVAEPAARQFYLPLAQTRRTAAPFFVVRMHGPATVSDVASIHDVIDPILGDGRLKSDVRRVADRLAPQTRPWRVAATLFLLFGVLALTSAAAGVYGLVGYDVTQRMREIGVRIALGATTVEIIRLVVRDGLRVIVIGVGCGAVAALAASRVTASLLFATSPSDPVVISVAAVVLVMVALAASAIPAWRATRVDPVIALRSE